MTNREFSAEKYQVMLEKDGAVSILIIDPHEVITAPWTVFKCQFGCSQYGHNARSTII